MRKPLIKDMPKKKLFSWRLHLFTSHGNFWLSRAVKVEKTSSYTLWQFPPIRFRESVYLGYGILVLKDVTVFAGCRAIHMCSIDPLMKHRVVVDQDYSYECLLEHPENKVTGWIL